MNTMLLNAMACTLVRVISVAASSSIVLWFTEYYAVASIFRMNVVLLTFTSRCAP